MILFFKVYSMERVQEGASSWETKSLPDGQVIVCLLQCYTVQSTCFAI